MQAREPATRRAASVARDSSVTLTPCRFPISRQGQTMKLVRTANHRPASIRGGFTLIEILVVIVVISLLAALVAPNVFQHVGAAKDATAKSQIEMLGAALDAFRLDNGRYPTTDQGLEALWQEPVTEPRPNNWRGPYTRKDIPLDPWTNAYLYLSPGVVHPTGFDLVTYGADGQPGGEGEDADISN
jgi:general secretion pathway protein G